MKREFNLLFELNKFQTGKIKNLRLEVKSVWFPLLMLLGLLVLFSQLPVGVQEWLLSELRR